MMVLLLINTFSNFIKTAISQANFQYTFNNMNPSKVACVCAAFKFQVEELGCVCVDEIIIPSPEDHCTCSDAEEIISPFESGEEGEEGNEGEEGEEEEEEEEEGEEEEGEEEEEEEMDYRSDENPGPFSGYN
ncbi:hypothetical protein RF11_07093 [Thelohanellus kitauei]|uniref:Uncharacterized protein n=1 Tax=Thelohanellus kitauei TaxID=669202 RepID=A0A0C2IA74_THEKT|nr:hypothetical protein RF11_07093 [Thelohanellus kitauei]